MKGTVICKTSDSGHGVTFVCSKCGKTLFVNALCKRTECFRCGTKFKPIIKIERSK